MVGIYHERDGELIGKTIYSSIQYVVFMRWDKYHMLWLGGAHALSVL